MLAQHDHKTRKMFTATLIYIRQKVTVSQICVSFVWNSKEQIFRQSYYCSSYSVDLLTRRILVHCRAIATSRSPACTLAPELVAVSV